MVELEAIYCGYGLKQHKGYGTQMHLASLRRLGPSPIHRRSFRPVKEMVPA
jgi:ribonuclease HII